MPDLPSLLGKIPDEYKPMAAIGMGALMLVCIVLFHGTGLHHILLLHKRGERRVLAGKLRRWELVVLFTWVVALMLTLHLLEIMIWAFALDHLGLMPRVQDAIYFCANAYTTEGYGTVDLERHWRNISPIIAISGLFTFAWTTSLLVDVVGSHRRLLALLEEERERNQAPGGTLFERYKIWKEKRREERDPRAAAGERNRG
ncbi:MAG TPA: ion channel [Candidatus Cybelea sp.]|nr:ion channel [Candidatus Cybelea sp.]